MVFVAGGILLFICFAAPNPPPRPHGTQPGDSAYSVQAGTVNLQANAVTMDVLNKNNNVLLAVTITALEGSTARSVANVPRPRAWRLLPPQPRRAACLSKRGLKLFVCVVPQGAD